MLAVWVGRPPAFPATFFRLGYGKDYIAFILIAGSHNVARGLRNDATIVMFPDRLVPQLATLVDAPPKGGGWIYEIKLDGYRILGRCDTVTVRLFSRNENDWTAKMQSLAREVARLPVETAWLDGEVVVMGDNGV